MLTLAGEVRRDYIDLTRALANRRGSVVRYLGIIEPLLKFLDYARRTPDASTSEARNKLLQRAKRSRPRKPRK
jgi:hypothetical protein